MYAQLGNIIFEGLKGFDTMSFSGDEATFAELSLIGNKPRLQRTGTTLQELQISIKFHQRFCNVKDQLEALKAYKDAGEILPLLLGNGTYINDFVITAMPYKIEDALFDGSPISVSLDLTLKEFVSYDKAAQARLAARKKAFAVGNKKPVVRRNPQPENDVKVLSRNIADVQMQGAKTDALVAEYENNPSKREVLAKNIKSACTTAKDKMTAIEDQLAKQQGQANKYSAMQSTINSVKSAYTAVVSVTPPSNISDLRNANTYLQSTLRKFSSNATPVFTDVILRRN